MRHALFLFLLLCSLYLQVTITTLPLMLVVLLLFWIISRDTLIFLAAFFAGIVFDMLRLSEIGTTSLFFVLFLFVIVLYERKLEVETFPFVFFSSLLGAFVFLSFVEGSHVIVQSILTALLSVFSFGLLVHFNTKKENTFSFHKV